MKLISISEVSVNYDGLVALEDVNMDIYDGDFLGVIGPNGGGKTTLIKAILGNVPYKGNIEYNPILEISRKRKNIGYLPQLNDFDTRFPISIAEVVISGLQGVKGFGRYRSEDKDKAIELLDLMGIKEIAHRPVGEVSGGQLQRALLCRSIISEPKLLILDEPANFVDNKFEKELYEILHVLNDRMAIIMVSHDLGTITSVVKNIVCVNRHVHRHDSNNITAEQLQNYDCPLQIISHGEIPHTVLHNH